MLLFDHFAAMHLLFGKVDEYYFEILDFGCFGKSSLLVHHPSPSGTDIETETETHS